MYWPESWRPTLVRVSTPSAIVCFHGSGARSLDQVITGGGSPDMQKKEEEEEAMMVEKRAQQQQVRLLLELTGGLARHDDRVSLYHRHLPGAHRRQRRPEPALHKDLHLDLRHALSVPTLADVDARVVRVDGGPLQKERGHTLLLLLLFHSCSGSSRFSQLQEDQPLDSSQTNNSVAEAAQCYFL